MSLSLLHRPCRDTGETIPEHGSAIYHLGRYLLRKLRDCFLTERGRKPLFAA